MYVWITHLKSWWTTWLHGNFLSFKKRWSCFIAIPIHIDFYEGHFNTSTRVSSAFSTNAKANERIMSAFFLWNINISHWKLITRVHKLCSIHNSAREHKFVVKISDKKQHEWTESRSRKLRETIGSKIIVHYKNLNYMHFVSYLTIQASICH